MVLLDTCAVLWLSAGAPIRSESNDVIESARAEDALLVSPITAWEIAIKHARRPEALGLAVAPEDFFQSFTEQPGIELAELSVQVLVESTRLPDYPGRDPVDRMIVATAIAAGARVVTGDEQMLAYLDNAVRF